MRYETALKLARTERCRFLVEGLDLEAATDIPGAEWEPFQIDFLNDDGLARLDRKSRQAGWSWLTAGEAVAEAQLNERDTSLFLSINREESSEKIRYARTIYDALYPSWRVPLVSDNMTSLAWSNGSRILSMPQRPSRGKPRSKVYLDEFAHYRLDRQIYAGSFPVTTKGGRIRIGSTTLGARGMFWEIDQERMRPYPGFTRANVPWYAVSALLQPQWREHIRVVTRLAPGMTVEERIERFANDRLRDIFDNMPVEDFLQEYEGEYVDETAAYITWDDIIACTASEEELQQCWVTHDPESAFSAIAEIAEAVAQEKITGPLVWGLDVGRKRDLTELVILELAGSIHITRAVLTLPHQLFETQYQLCRVMLDNLPTVIRGFMDQNGLGMQLAETLHLRDGYGERAMPMVFTNPTKSVLATHLKTRFQRRRRGSILIPNDRDLKYQVHSIRRHVTQSNNVVFDVEASERHHADKFWALACANEAGETLGRIAAYPSQANVSLRTTHKLDALSAAPQAPDLGEVPGFGLTREDLDHLIAEGLAGAIKFLPAGTVEVAVAALASGQLVGPALAMLPAASDTEVQTDATAIAS